MYFPHLEKFHLWNLQKIFIISITKPPCQTPLLFTETQYCLSKIPPQKPRFSALDEGLLKRRAAKWKVIPSFTIIRRMTEYISCKTILLEQNSFPKSLKVWLSCRLIKRSQIKTISLKRRKQILDCSQILDEGATWWYTVRNRPILNHCCQSHSKNGEERSNNATIRNHKSCLQCSNLLSF